MCSITSISKRLSMKVKSLSIITVISVCLLLLSLTHTVLAKNHPDVSKEIIVGGDYHYPPYEFLDKNGSPTG